MWVLKIMQRIGEIMSSTIFMHFTGNPSIPAAFLWSSSFNVFQDFICSCWEKVESVGNDK